MRKDRVLAVAALILGLLFIVIGVVYFIEPASSLPGFFPGHEASSSHHHAKHGIAAVLLGAACLVFAWFKTGPDKNGPKKSSKPAT